MSAYYNEIDPVAAKWLRNLIAAGHIAPGVVDERSIEDVVPNELAGFTQCHFFAGVGVWSLALRNAGWPDDRPVWTGSCPCQPFSSAGKGDGFADERHLWPAFFHLISQRQPATVLGEQVASRDADVWIDLVQDDLEALGYAFGCVAFPSAGVGAPHIRDRAFWLANANGAGRGARSQGRTPMGHRAAAEPDRGAGRLDNSDNARLEGFRGGHNNAPGQRAGTVRPVAETSEPVWLADADSQQRQDRQSWVSTFDEAGGREQGATTAARLCSDSRPGPVNGFWGTADWLGCRDGKWRPVEPGTFPLAHGAPGRVGRLRAYGNAINAEAAKAFIQSTGLI